MQAVIMAGGKGSRLASVTKGVMPKPMVPVAGKPLLLWQIEELKRNGIEDIILVIGYMGNIIEEFFQDGSSYDVHISYIREQTPLGTAGAFYELKELLLEPYFLLVFGDVYFAIDIQRMEAFHKEHQAKATLFVHPNGHPFDSDLVVLDRQKRIERFDSKHNVRNGWYDNCVNAGFYILDRSICELVQRGTRTDLEKEILMPLAEQGDAVYGYCSSEYIKDIGTVERIQQAEEDIAGGYILQRRLNRKQKCIFLDRDGTVNVYKGLLWKEEDFELEDGAAEAIRRINQSGYLCMVITNQPVVARGLCGISDVEQIHKKMATLLGREGAYLDGVYYCPHHPDCGYPGENPQYKISCTCRKPDIGLIRQAAEAYNIDLTESWMVGDTTTDIKTGIHAGMHTALVLTGEAGKDGKYSVMPETTGANLIDVVEHILQISYGGMKMDFTKDIKEYIELERDVLSHLDIDAINHAINLIMEAYEKGKCIYIFGNGGSAATASHYQNDFNKGISEYVDKKFRFVCLNDNIATVMAIANDIGYEEVFRFQLENKLEDGDLIIAISGSGNSENVIRAVEYAKGKGNQIIGMCGYDGGKLRKIADVALHVGINSMQITEDVHMIFDHLIMSIFYRTLCGKDHLKKCI